MSRHKCSFIGCSRTKHRFPPYHFFAFPINRPEICEQWIKNCANTSLVSVPTKTLKWRVVCENHFSSDSFTSLMKTRLNRNAIPTILCDNEDDSTAEIDPDQDVAYQTTPEKTPLSCKPAARRSIFSPANSPTSINQGIQTPEYKKWKSSRCRKATPRKPYTDTPRKKKLVMQLKSSNKIKNKYKQRVRRLTVNMKKKILSKGELIEGIKDYLPESVAKFFAMQLNHANKKTLPWSEDEKKQSLRMRYKSPALYDQMRSEGFALPSRSSMARWLEEINLRPGLCSDMLNILRPKIESMSGLERKTILMFDEMSIKSDLQYDSKRDAVEGIEDLGDDARKPAPASSILLVMARGITHKWKFPIAYFPCHNAVSGRTVAKIVKDCSSTVQELGLEVKAVVCDLSTTNRKAANQLGVKTETPFFLSNEQKVFFIYDIPHIVKCIRNRMMKNGKIFTNEGTADWREIVALYNIDRGSCQARATKLTDKHIRPNTFEKMRVKLATQVFSHSVSTAMHTAVESKELPESAKETACFIEKLNNVFDAFNSRRRFDPNPHKCALSISTNPHFQTPLKTIQDGLKLVKSWHTILNGKSSKPPSFHGLIHTMNAIILLWEDLKKEKVTYLMTGRLNQDALENEFSIIRIKCGYNRNPSVTNFRQNLRHRLQTSLLKPSSGANCVRDEDELLVTANRDTSNTPSTPHNSDPTDHALDAEEEDAEEEELLVEDVALQATPQNDQSLESNAIRYFSGFAVHACLKRFACEICKTELTTRPSQKKDETLSWLRRYNQSVSDDQLTFINDETTDITRTVLVVFNNMFYKDISSVGIKKKMLLKAKQLIYRRYSHWMKSGSECNLHREFILNKLFIAKIKRSLLEMSKDLRQPHGKTSFWLKCQNIQNL